MAKVEHKESPIYENSVFPLLSLWLLVSVPLCRSLWAGYVRLCARYQNKQR